MSLISPSKRLKVILEYDGTNYCGWQMQPSGVSIQGLLTAAWTRIEGHPVILHAAGRTDAGVHALGQVMHLEVGKKLAAERWQAAVNSMLPPDIRVRQVEPCPADFHARFSAVGKLYRYRFWKGRVVSPFWYRYVHPVPANLNWVAMQEAAAGLLGTHDFTAFTVADCETATHVRTIIDIQWSNPTDDLTEISFYGNGFLKYQVRRMVGALLEIGRGRLPVATIGNCLRGMPPAALLTAPAKGLTLVRVDY
ncbi:MAG: tRNA pseudouridine(38-40) synthase TruA [Blastocatellia bacterium]|nr:tRNA pseudouridine(38-40) synthase TruA [Blastocatellia bacterium]